MWLTDLALSEGSNLVHSVHQMADRIINRAGFRETEDKAAALVAGSKQIQFHSRWL
jgi:hypothetical protein